MKHIFVIIKFIILAIIFAVKVVFKVAGFMGRNFLVIVSGVWILVTLIAIALPTDPNFISQDHPDHPCNIEL